MPNLLEQNRQMIDLATGKVHNVKSVNGFPLSPSTNIFMTQEVLHRLDGQTVVNFWRDVVNHKLYQDYIPAV